jgi:hypothetical protein
MGSLMEIHQALLAQQAQVRSHFNALSESEFFAHEAERWSPAQHLGHLTAVCRNVTRGLQSKDRLPDVDHPSRDYETIRQIYLGALAQAPASIIGNNPFVTVLPEHATPAQVIRDYVLASGALLSALIDWDDSDLDSKGMKHPLIGMLSVREMMHFVLYHERHHMVGTRVAQDDSVQA